MERFEIEGAQNTGLEARVELTEDRDFDLDAITAALAETHPNLKQGTHDMDLVVKWSDGQIIHAQLGIRDGGFSYYRPLAIGQINHLELPETT